MNPGSDGVRSKNLQAISNITHQSAKSRFRLCRLPKAMSPFQSHTISLHNYQIISIIRLFLLTLGALISASFILIFFTHFCEK